MLSMLRCLFKRQARTDPEPQAISTKTPVAGEYWLLEDDSPWPKHYPPVRIIDVGSGWVRYWMGNIFPDCRMQTKEFIRIYRFSHNGEQNA